MSVFEASSRDFPGLSGYRLPLHADPIVAGCQTPGWKLAIQTLSKIPFEAKEGNR